MKNAHAQIIFLSNKMAPRVIGSLSRAFSRAFSSSVTKVYRSQQRQRKRFILLAAAGIGLGGAYYARQRWMMTLSSVECKEEIKTEKVKAGEVVAGLTEYTLEEVKKRRGGEEGGGRVWVTYGRGVYDITDFLSVHPGGSEKIALAAGSALEPYWEVFANHNTDEVRDILEELRIGNVSPADFDKLTRESPTKSGPYANDPQRSPVLKINTHTPFNAETPPILLAESFITPNDIFFVRNHLPVPRVDPETYRLEVRGVGIEKPLSLTLDDLKNNFPRHTVTSTIQCAGNRRAELNSVKQVKGIPWTGGAIGTAEWSGARLRDVLIHAGVKEEEIEHVHLEGLDHNPLTGERYGGSIPASKALSSAGDCLLAYEMNGVEIPADHGYPVRAIVPGVVGARNVKWLAAVISSNDEYLGFWQKNDYKGFSPSVDWNNVDFSTAPAIQELPVTSLITSPKDEALVSEDVIPIRGIAWSGGGREVVRVDVSADGGKTWHVAEIIAGAGQPYMRAWAWVIWETNICLEDKENDRVELCCKAVDRSYNVQPDTTAPIWNLRGCLSNAWHRVNIQRK